MEYPRAYKWHVIEYPLKYDIILHLGLPQEYSYSYSPRRNCHALSGIALIHDFYFVYTHSFRLTRGALQLLMNRYG